MTHKETVKLNMSRYQDFQYIVRIFVVFRYWQILKLVKNSMKILIVNLLSQNYNNSRLYNLNEYDLIYNRDYRKQNDGWVHRYY